MKGRDDQMRYRRVLGKRDRRRGDKDEARTKRIIRVEEEINQRVKA